MACSLQLKAINTLRDKGVIDNTYKILNLKEFNRLNSLFTSTANNKYNLGADNLLFDVNERNIKLPGSTYRRDNINTIYRAVPRQDLFQKLEDIINLPIVEETALEEFNEPDITLEFVSNATLVKSGDAIANKKLQDNLKARDKELKSLIKCVWS